MKRFGLLLAVAAGLYAQQQVTLTAIAPVGVGTIGAAVSGTPGQTQACYWIVSNFTGGGLLSANPVQINNVPNTLSGSNFVILSWTPAAGVVTQDVLKTTVAGNGGCTLPTSGASIALSTGNGPTVNTVNDQGGGLSTYNFTAFPFLNASATLTLNNRDYVTPTIVLAGNPGVPPFLLGPLTLSTITTNSLTVAAGLAITQTSPTDGFYELSLGACGLHASTGAFDAAAATNGINPGLTRVAAGNFVLQGLTTAAANAVDLDCDISPPSRLTAGRGVTLSNVQIFYGVQTTALTSITAPVVNSITYPATGAAAGATVAPAGGSLTITPGTLQLTTTTSGQCFSENISFGTPIALNTDLRRITLEQVFNQSAAAVTNLQVCGVLVHYTNTPL